MSIDFFHNNCKENPRKEKLFGICDDQNGAKAYTDIANHEAWIARVINDSEFDILFTAIDNCIDIYKKGTKEK